MKQAENDVTAAKAFEGYEWTRTAANAPQLERDHASLINHALDVLPGVQMLLEVMEMVGIYDDHALKGVFTAQHRGNAQRLAIRSLANLELEAHEANTRYYDRKRKESA